MTPSSPSTDLLEAADALFRARAWSEACTAYETAFEAATEQSHLSNQVEASSQIARTWLVRQEADTGRPFLERAAALATEEDPLGWSRFLGVRGRFEWKSGALPAAASTFEQMYAHCMAHDQHSRAVDAAHMMAIVGTPEQQLHWATKGIEAAELGEQRGWLGPLWNNLGWTHHDRGDYPAMLAALEKARDYHREGTGELAKLTADIFVAQAHRLCGHLEEARTGAEAARIWAERLVAEEHDGAGERLSNCHRELGELAALAGHTDVALQHLSEAHRRYDEAGAASWDAGGLASLRARVETLTQEVSSPGPPR